MNDYERIARIIRLLDDAFLQQPTLADLSAAAGLSPSHFHRLFRKWTGITPKDFVQCLTAEHAKLLLRNGASVLDSALDSGLSGPGRLHDLCVTLEAASPGELKTRGRNLVINHGFAPSPFGECLVASTPRGICALAFIDPTQRQAALHDLKRDWPHARHSHADSEARTTLETIFSSPSERPRHLRAVVNATPFQLRVWRALLRVPEGSAVSYTRIASSIGQPAAARAVGSAVAANPLAVLIPCHRVIRQTGVLGNYRWGPGRKRALLAWESARQAASALDPAPRPA